MDPVEPHRWNLVVRDPTGTFEDDAEVQVSNEKIGVIENFNADIPPRTQLSYLAMAQNDIRAGADQTIVPGSGPIRGAFQLGETLYAFRDNDAGTAQIMYESSGAGWVAVELFDEIEFDTGDMSAPDSPLPLDGAELEQSGNTATIKRVVAEAGAWLGGSAQGRFIITDHQGNPFAAGAANVKNDGLTTANATVMLGGAHTAIALAPGGHWQWIEHNFRGSAETIRAYGCDGKNRIHDFDGETLVPIRSALTEDDKPTLIATFQNHLVYAYGSSLFWSGIDYPYRHDRSRRGRAKRLWGISSRA